MTNQNLKITQVIGARIVNLTYGYQTHSAAMEVALHPKVLDFIDNDSSLINSTGEIPRLNDQGWQYGKILWLRAKDFNAELADDFAAVWIAGVIIKIGDLLAQHEYFDRHPLLEMIRHMRNAIAHGNRFRIDSEEKLKKYPANNIGAKMNGWNHGTLYEITYGLNGKQFMGSYMLDGNILDILLSCGFYLLEKP